MIRTLALKTLGWLWLSLGLLVIFTFASYCHRLYVASLPLWDENYYVPWLGYHLFDLSMRVVLACTLFALLPGGLLVRRGRIVRTKKEQIC